MSNHALKKGQQERHDVTTVVPLFRTKTFFLKKNGNGQKRAEMSANHRMRLLEIHHIVKS